MQTRDEADPIRPPEYRAGELIEPAGFEPYRPVHRRRLFYTRPRNILIGLALLICAGAAWFIVTGKAVYIHTEPPQAEIAIEGGWQLKLADRFLLRQGDYRLRISAPGYHALEQTLAVGEQQNQQYTYSLEKLPGHLQIALTPAVAAEVWLNGTLRGQAPGTLSGLAPGDYTLRLVADRFLPYESTVTIEGLDRTLSLSAELAPAWGNVRLETLPAGAEVYVDDEPAGQTPLTAELLQGEHTLRIKLPGHKDWRKTLRVVAGEDQALTGIRLEPADAVVQIVTRPAGAGVTVDGEYKGVAPLEVALTPGRAATIRLFSQGFEAAVQTVTARSGDQRTLQIELKPEIAEVQIVADPPDAELYIDGTPYGPANRSVQLSTRQHTVEIRKAGHVDYKTTITPRPGIAQQINARLKTVDQARREAIRPVVQSPGGQTLRLFEGGSITMGASRREPGRRANEIIRNVQLTRPFYLSETEVSNAEFRQFDPNHNSGELQGNDLNGDKQPAVNLNWEQAALYCNWLSEKASLTPFYIVADNKVSGFNPAADGYRLPSEAEWEWAARDQGNNVPLRFPWGETMPPATRDGNYADVSAAAILGTIITDYTDGHVASAQVASFPANRKGLYDMGGNVAEWVHDYYDLAIVDSEATLLDPLGPDSGEHHVIRGSAWSHGSLVELRLSFRDYGSEKRNDVGFRIARYAE